MNRLRTIAIEEQRQLITLGFAVLVFLMTLVALQINGGSTLSRVATVNRDNVNHAMSQNAPAGARNYAVALASTTSIGLRSTDELTRTR